MADLGCCLAPGLESIFSCGDSLFGLGQSHFWDRPEFFIVCRIYIRREQAISPSAVKQRGRAATELVTVIFPPPSPSTHFPLMSPWVLINHGSFSPNCSAETMSEPKRKSEGIGWGYGRRLRCWPF